MLACKTGGAAQVSHTDPGLVEMGRNHPWRCRDRPRQARERELVRGSTAYLTMTDIACDNLERRRRIRSGGRKARPRNC